MYRDCRAGIKKEIFRPVSGASTKSGTASCRSAFAGSLFSGRVVRNITDHAPTSTSSRNLPFSPKLEVFTREEMRKIVPVTIPWAAGRRLSVVRVIYGLLKQRGRGCLVSYARVGGRAGTAAPNGVAGELSQPAKGLQFITTVVLIARSRRLERLPPASSRGGKSKNEPL